MVTHRFVRGDRLSLPDRAWVLRTFDERWTGDHVPVSRQNIGSGLLQAPYATDAGWLSAHWFICLKRQPPGKRARWRVDRRTTKALTKLELEKAKCEA